MTSGIASKGVDLDSIFDLYQAGTTKARPAGLNVAGSDTSNRYANIIYGSAAAATGIQSENADINTLYAAKGTANYALPINGNSYVHAYSVVSGTGHSTIGFSTTSSGWQVYGSHSGGAQTALASGTMPASASKVQFTWGSYTVDNQDAGGATSNSAATAQPITIAQDAHYTTGDFGALAATHGRDYIFTIDFFDASNDNISHTVINLEAVIEGST